MEERGLRAAEGPSTSVQLMTLSAVTCCIRWCRGFTFAERYASMYDFYSECVRKGCILSDEPLFTISDRQDYWEGVIREAPYPYAVCVPVRPETAPADAVTLPECRALSVLYCGDYTGVDEAWLTLGREAKARKLTPAAPPRILGIIAPYTGREIETRHHFAPGSFCRCGNDPRRNTKKLTNKIVRQLGGSGWIRTTVGTANRFTVCPLWPLGNTPISPSPRRRKWSWWTDSNPRPADYKSAALPAELHQHFCLSLGASIILP